MDGPVAASVAASLRQEFGERVRFDEPLRRHTSFRIGGPADVWMEVERVDEIVRLKRLAAAARLPFMIFGGGTNVLVSDAGIRGVVIKLGRAFARLEWTAAGECTRVRAGAAIRFRKLVTEAARRSLSGLEFAEGIPGSLGGGLLMNAGAFGGEIATVVEGIGGIGESDVEEYLPRSALRFGYRFFELPPRFVVTSVKFLLRPDEVRQIDHRIAEAKRRRQAHQPLGLPNAGSIFKNPPGGFAGRLIESVGLKGRRIGGAMVSEQHANFIVNVGDATAAHVKQLIEEISATVERERAVQLVPEIKLIGEWE